MLRTNDSGPLPILFPPSPVPGSGLLVPIISWPRLFDEILVTGVELDAFWCQSILDRVAYFFQWVGEPRCTVLAVWNGSELTHVECRACGDRLLSGSEALDIERQMVRAFRDVGFTSLDC